MRKAPLVLAAAARSVGLDSGSGAVARGSALASELAAGGGGGFFPARGRRADRGQR